MWSLIQLLYSDLFCDNSCTPSKLALSQSSPLAAGGDAALDDVGRFKRKIHPA